MIRRTEAGKSPFAADRQHLHHRLLNMGHSHRQSVLLMYLWAALFSGTVVGLSLVRISLIWLALATVGAIAVLLLATMPRLRPWRGATVPRHGVQRVRTVRSDEPASATSYAAAAPDDAAPNATLPDGMPAQGAALDGRPVNGLPANGLPANGLPPNGLPPQRVATERVAGDRRAPNGPGRRAPLPNRRGPGALTSGTSGAGVGLRGHWGWRAGFWCQSLSDVPELGEGAPRGPARWSCKVSNQVK